MAHRHIVVGLVLLVTLGVLAGMLVHSANAGSMVRTIAVGRNPLAVAVDERIGRAFVLNNAGNSVSMLDTATGTLLRTVAVGRDPLALAVDERTGHVFVAKNELGLQDQLSLALNCCPRGKGSVTVLDARSGAIQRTVHVGLSPLAIGVDQRTGRAFVINQNSESVSVLDTRSGALVHTTNIGSDLFALAVDEQTGRVFVA